MTLSCAPSRPATPAAERHCDLLVVGGGINGAGIARDAAGRGLSVLLCERDDLAAHTSSASTKLIHGGLRYLEHYEFRLVRKALQERETLLRSAPHLIHGLRFVMPHDPSMRPAWMIRLGLWLYDHLARRESLPGSAQIRLAAHAAGMALQPRFTRGFVYSDARVDDARLVVLTARDAAERGATIMTRTACEAAWRDGDGWLARLREGAGDGRDGRATIVRARALVNAAGPWAGEFLHARAHTQSRRTLRLVKGSHIVVPRLFEHEHAYLLQNDDRRIVFAIPYERDFTLIGTTEADHDGDPADVQVAPGDIDYLCRAVNRWLRQQLSPADVVWQYAGVRPLLDEHGAAENSALTRDYALELDSNGAPLLTVWGGKLTTFRRLAEEAVDLLAPRLGKAGPHWTHDAVLPGGDLGPSSAPARTAFDGFVAKQSQALPWLPAPLLQRYARQYGSRLGRIVGTARSLAELGAEVAPGLYEAELDYLQREEWARTADDVIWRRTKLGLRFDAAQVAAIDEWLRRRGPPSGDPLVAASR